MVKKNTCVFISGSGSNLKYLIKNSRNENFPIKIKLVISDNKNAKGLFYAKINSIPYLVINTKKRSFENLILKELKKCKITFICLAGYMKIISKKFLQSYRKIIINIHPSLLPKFKGLNIFKRVLKNKEKKSGCTVHFVNEKLDGGTKIIQKTFFINKNDNKEILKIKTQKLEYRAFSEAIIKIFRYS
ncbi:MAG: phosphoribosylglycinamide formyltransferase [Candidatus Pelagibacter sp. TMED166]|nr:MAG: phosphoribosylglycinamide formyltransferase [Candidatus Pelagibacter sp. TMED166]|tara:strand:+ start:3793 stop:4356 length:564 start_codon:yes stop_codon:yes gene_type:complete